MLTPRSLITAITCVALVCGPVTASADPGNGNGNGKGNDKGGQHYDQDHGKQGGQGNKGKKSGADDRAHGPSINRAATLEIIHGHRDYWSRSQALPPGIQKNLASHCRRVLPKSWMADWPADCLITRGTNGSRWARS